MKKHENNIFVIYCIYRYKNIYIGHCYHIEPSISKNGSKLASNHKKNDLVIWVKILDTNGIILMFPLVFYDVSCLFYYSNLLKEYISTIKRLQLQKIR